MKRRTVLLSLTCLPLTIAEKAISREAVSVEVADRSHHIRFLNGGKNQDGLYPAAIGVLIALGPGWKTYWRVAGKMGVAPQFDWQGSVNLVRSHVEFPVPTRIFGQEGETIGYKDQLVLPLCIEAKDPTQGIELCLALSIGICKNICIPVNEVLKTLPPPSEADRLLLERSQRLVPQLANEIQETPVLSAHLVEDAPMSSIILLRLCPKFSARYRIEDIFIETENSLYFHAPQFDSTRHKARLKSAAQIAVGTKLRLTLACFQNSFEQTISLE